MRLTVCNLGLLHELLQCSSVCFFCFVLFFFFLKFYLVFSGVDLLSSLIILHTDYRQKIRGNFVEFLW